MRAPHETATPLRRFALLDAYCRSTGNGAFNCRYYFPLIHLSFQQLSMGVPSSRDSRSREFARSRSRDYANTFLEL
jgi:hypothetical protein